MNEDKLNRLMAKALKAAQEYWEERARQNGLQDNAIVWVRNDETGEMVCFTKGEYTGQLSNFINKMG